MARPRIMFDHDGRHPLIYMYEPPIQREELEAAVDELAGTPVEALMLMLGDVRSLLYKTRTGEVWGQDVEKWPHIIWRRASQNFAHLIEEGNDPLRVLCDRAHAKGMLLYAQLLGQQGARERMLKSWEKEGFDADDWQCDLQPLDIGNKGGVERDWPGYCCPDFARSEVREGTLAVIKEVMSDYPVDGFELELNYWPYYFHPDEVESGRQIMTEWIGQVHAAVKESDAERELAVRVPVDVEGGLAVGLDPLGWMRAGIVDVVIPEASVNVDPEADFRPFVEAAGETPCRIIAAIKNMVDSDRVGEARIEMMRAAACNYWAQGIDGIYMAHWFAGWPYGAEFYEKLREIAHPEVMAAKDKFYRLPTTNNAPAKPVIAPETPNSLPLELEVGEPVQIEFSTSDDLPRWDAVGRVHEVLLRVFVQGNTELDRLDFKFNGAVLPDRLLRKINQMYLMSAPRYRMGGYWYIFLLDREFWPIEGKNKLEVTLLERDAEVEEQVYVHSVEMEIKYLMGRNFHRGFVDTALGAYEQ